MCLLCCGACLSQIILFILNFILSLVSLAVTGIGIFALIQVHRVSEADIDYLNSAPIVVIAVGAVFSAIFFCGCCGAFCKNKCMLNTYAAITVVLATATVVFTVFVFKGTNELQERTEGVLTDTLGDPRNKDVLNGLESVLGCCGTTGPEYYNSSIPVSCCPGALQDLQGLDPDNITVVGDITNTTAGGSVTLSCPVSEAHEKGCVEVFIQLLSKVFRVAGQVLIWISVIQYVAAFLAIFLSCYIGRS